MQSAKTKSIFGAMLSFPAFRFFVVTLLALMVAAGCASQNSSRVNEGASTGAVVGAGIGLLIGALRGDAEIAAAGLAVGAAVGAGEGAYQGWKQEQDDERARQLVEAIKESKSSTTQPSNTSPADRAREELTRFLGVWSMEGWMQEPGEERLTVKAKVNGDVEMSYFVELAYIDIEVPGLKTQVWGTSMLGYADGEGYNITTRFNTLPEPVRLSGGNFSSSTRTFTFSEPGARVVVRFENPDRFTTETFITTGGSEQQVEFYRFTRS